LNAHRGQRLDMSITISRLRTFTVLAATKSFAKTAAIVGRSQPSVTEQIRTLEEAVGVLLFHRQTRSVTVTSEGHLFLERVQNILAELDSLVRDFKKFALLETGEVKVGVTPTLACYILPEVIGTFRKKYPGIRVLCTDEPAARLEKMVEQQDLDFYLGPKPSPQSGLRFRVVAQDPYVIVAPRRHPLVKLGCTDPRELAKYPFLLMRSGTAVRDEIDRFFKRHKLKILPVEEVSNHFTLGGLVEADCGITLLPRSAHPVIAHPGTTIVDIPDPKFIRILGVATRSNYKPGAAAASFLSSMIPLVKRMVEP